MKYAIIIPLLFLLILPGGIQLHAQDTSNVVKVNFDEALKKGNFVLSVGVNFFTNVVKNEDQLIYYALDDYERNLNIKLGAGYFIKDNHPIGIGFRYFSRTSNVVYENIQQDTITYNEESRDYITNIFYGIAKPMFNSKRVYMISDPSLFFSIGSTKANREVNKMTEFSNTNRYSISLGLNVGIMVFLAPKMSAQISVGPVGVGYTWEKFYLNGVPNGDTANFFVRMSPSLLSFEFTISRYF